MRAPVLVLASATAIVLLASGPLAAQPGGAPAPAAAPEVSWHASATALAATTATEHIEASTTALGARLAAGLWLHRSFSLVGSLGYLRGAHAYTFDGATERWTSHNLGAGVGARVWGSRLVWAEVGVGATLYRERTTQGGPRLDTAVGVDFGHRPGVSLELRVTHSALNGDGESDAPSVTTVGLGLGVSWH